MLDDELIVGLCQPQGQAPGICGEVLRHQQRARGDAICELHRVRLIEHAPILYGIRPAPYAKDVGVAAAPILQHIVAHAPIEHVIACIAEELVVARAA